jgi:hypothetical protein
LKIQVEKIVEVVFGIEKKGRGMLKLFIGE